MKRFKHLCGTILQDRHKAERLHTVCLLGIIQYLLVMGATVFVTSATVTTLIMLRDAHMALLGDIINEMS